MKLISWNCNRAFRQKYSCLESYCADIIVAPKAKARKNWQSFAAVFPARTISGWETAIRRG